MSAATAVKRKPGRPPFDPGRLSTRTQVSLDNETVQRIRELGIGNLSAWIRAQVASAWEALKG